MRPNELIQRAMAGRAKAYCPYSGYAVGAAIESETGSIYLGCNVENVSYGATLCAERVALGAMVSSGERRIRRVAIATDDGGTPCGICLQALSEFGRDAEVWVVDADGNAKRYLMRELLPVAFGSAEVNRTERSGS